MSGGVTLPTRRESCRTGVAEVKRNVAAAECGVTARPGVTQPRLQVVIFVVPPTSAQGLQCPAAPVPDIVVILKVISPARTADRLMPSAMKTPSNKAKTRRDGDMAASMAMKPSAYKRPHGPVTFRRAVADASEGAAFSENSGLATVYAGFQPRRPETSSISWARCNRRARTRVFMGRCGPSKNHRSDLFARNLRHHSERSSGTWIAY